MLLYQCYFMCVCLCMRSACRAGMLLSQRKQWCFTHHSCSWQLTYSYALVVWPELLLFQNSCIVAAVPLRHGFVSEPETQKLHALTNDCVPPLCVLKRMRKLGSFGHMVLYTLGWLTEEASRNLSVLASHRSLVGLFCLD